MVFSAIYMLHTSFLDQPAGSKWIYISIVLDQCRCVFFFVHWQICISSSTGMVVEAYLWLLSSVPFLGQASWKCEKKTWLNPQNPYRRVPSCKHTKKCGKVENPTFTGYFRNGVPDGFTIYLYVYPRAWTTNFTLPPIVVGVPVVTCAYTRAEKDQPRICCMALT
jgi:hypothetical protein